MKHAAGALSQVSISRVSLGRLRVLQASLRGQTTTRLREGTEEGLSLPNFGT